MPNSEIERIELNHDGSISLKVNVSGYDVGSAVELSGHVTQGNGAIATFYSVAQMPTDETPWVISVTAVPPAPFDEGLSVTVVARAAQVWLTTLDPDTDPGADTSRKDSSALEGSWKKSYWWPAVAYPGQTAASIAPAWGPS